MIAEGVLRDIEHGRREVQEIAGSSASTIKFFVTHSLALTFFGDHRPARSIVPSGPLHFGALVEIEAVIAVGP